MQLRGVFKSHMTVIPDVCDVNVYCFHYGGPVLEGWFGCSSSCRGLFWIPTCELGYSTLLFNR